MMHGKQFQGIARGLLWRMITNDQRRRLPRHEPLWVAVIARRMRGRREQWKGLA